SCGQDVEFEIGLPEISELQERSDLVDKVEVEIDGELRRFRKCTGADQERWFESFSTDGADTAVKMIAGLSAEKDTLDRLRPGDIDAIEAAMDEADPLVNLSFTLTCGE